MSYVSLERGISYTCRIFLRATGAHFSKATSKWQEHQPILVKTTIFISKWPQATSNSKIWGAEILRSLYFYRYGISIYMCEICAVVYMYIHSICKLETCQKQNYFIFWYYNQKLITSIVCWSANKKRLSWHRHKNAFFSLKKKIINLGMISARHTTNRQSFKKMTFPFKTWLWLSECHTSCYSQICRGWAYVSSISTSSLPWFCTYNLMSRISITKLK